ncbi:uncharacterized protein BDZ99DRAFT_523763 [Mytilinidion resinicola]|uniref:F-box domain-containing protein n=1 Tax=Mytilinidion resinicola TaxID=574789 RepID=A0A6A6YE76_9PEZI|nr:uncharacterized protein BDZ99DRAFT_523763 [Mytilinidion resinicola]KAF2806304.1 hypothetical protein BDZ99DRAFT_523763 [Mytilinidion resinicola]
MPFSALPNELVLDTASYLDDASLSSLSEVSWRYYSLLEGEIFKRANADRPKSTPSTDVSNVELVPAIEWAVANEKVLLVRYLLDHGVTGINAKKNTWDIFCIVASKGYAHIDITSLFVQKAGGLGWLEPTDATRILHNILPNMFYVKNAHLKPPGYSAVSALKKQDGGYDKDQGRNVRRHDPDGSKTVKLIEQLLRTYDADPTRYSGEKSPQFGSFLHRTADYRIFELLIDYGADLEWSSSLRWPIIHHLISENYKDDSTLVRAVLEAGADPNQLWREWGAKSGGALPLGLAIRKGLFRVAKTLVKYGASTDVRYTPYGYHNIETTPLVETILFSNATAQLEPQSKFIEALLEAGTDINDRAIIHGRYVLPLDAAVMNPRGYKDRVALIHMLLSRGADPEKKNKDGRNLTQRIMQWKESDHAIRMSVLIQIALDLKLPSLLPGEYVLHAASEALADTLETYKISNSRYSLERLNRSTSSHETLKKVWATFQLVFMAYKRIAKPDDSVASTVHDFWDKNHARIKRLLGTATPAAVLPLQFGF